MITPHQLKTYGSNWKNLKHTPAYKNLCLVLKEAPEQSGTSEEDDGIYEPSIVDSMKEDHYQQILEAKEKTFEKELSKTRPVLNERAALNRIENKAAKLAHGMARVMEDAIAFQMSMSFLQKMVTQDLGADGSNLDYVKLTEYSKRLSAIPLIRLLGQHFDISDAEISYIINLCSSKYWGAKPSSPSVSNSNQNSTQALLMQKLTQVLEHLSAPDNKPFGPLLNRKEKDAR